MKYLKLENHEVTTNDFALGKDFSSLLFSLIGANASAKINLEITVLEEEKKTSTKASQDSANNEISQ